MRRHTVAEVMTMDVVTVPEQSGYRDIVEVLATNGVSAVPVLNIEGRVVGIVSEADLLHKVEFAGAPSHVGLIERRRTRAARAKSGADSARDLMTAPAVTIGPTESLAWAARLMDTKGIKRLPVVDPTGQLRGIVSRADLLRPFLRTDDDIRAEVRDEVILHAMWIDPNDLELTVEQGIVTVRGEMERHSLIPIMVGMIGTVAGVVGVTAHLTYRFDDSKRRAEPNVPMVA